MDRPTGKAAGYCTWGLVDCCNKEIDLLVAGNNNAGCRESAMQGHCETIFRGQPLMLKKIHPEVLTQSRNSFDPRSQVTEDGPSSFANVVNGTKQVP